MKKFNVKALSLAVAAAVVSGAAAAEEVNFAKAVGSKEDQGQAAFATIFGEGTTYDKGTGKLTFKKDSDALLLKTLELEQTINGFASGSNFITTDANGNKTVREATNEDIEADSLKGVGLAGGLTAVNARVDKLEEETDDQDETIEELKTAITTNGTRIAEVATGVNKLNESVAEMGKDISTKFDEVDSEISKASFELSESIEKVSEDVTAVNKRVDTLEQETAAAKTSAKAAEDKVTELSANIDSKVKEAKDAAANAVDAASKIDAVADKADKASKDVEDLNKTVDGLAERAALSIAENAQQIDGFKEGDEIVVTDDKGIKSVKTATKEDVEQDEFGGLGLREVAAKHDQSLADLTAEAERAKKAAEQAAFAAIENAQELNGFKEKDEIIVTDDNGVKSVKTATNEDVEADEFKGLGLKEAVKGTHKAAEQAALAAIENAQELNGFKEGDKIVVTKDDGSKVIRTATKEDVENADFEGMGLKEVVTAHDETLDDLTKAVTENNEALVKTAEVVNDISANVKANTTAIETKANKSEVEAAQKAAAQAAFATIENAQELNGFKEGDKIVVTKDDGSKVIRTATKEDVENADFEGMGLKEVVTAHDETLDDLTKAVTENNEALVKTAEVVNDISANVKANTTAIETKANKSEVKEAQKTALEAEKLAKSVQGSVEAAQKSAQTAESHAKAAQTSADAANNVASAAQTAAAQAQDAVKANAAQVAVNKADIATLQTASSQHAAGIAKNSARIDSLDKNVANLRKETRQGLAAQAALSGLFQPYSVGKFNVTAALGGFKSDTAVAVGAGYRFNENFAAKAGLAVGTSSGGSASYNVGVNYEW